MSDCNNQLNGAGVCFMLHNNFLDCVGQKGLALKPRALLNTSDVLFGDASLSARGCGLREEPPGAVELRPAGLGAIEQSELTLGFKILRFGTHPRIRDSACGIRDLRH